MFFSFPPSLLLLYSLAPSKLPEVLFLVRERYVCINLLASVKFMLLC